MADSLPRPLGLAVVQVLRVFDAFAVDGENYEELEQAVEIMRLAVAKELDHVEV